MHPLSPYSYVPVSTGGSLKAVPYSHHHGQMLWRSNMLGQPLLPAELGGGIDWDKVWGVAKRLGKQALPHVIEHGPKVAAKAIELGMQRLGLGAAKDDVFAELGSAMRAKRSTRARR